MFSDLKIKKLAFYEIRWKSRVETTEDNIIRRMRIAYWVTKATDTHPAYVILIALHGNNGSSDAPQRLRVYVLFNIVIHTIGNGSDIVLYNLN
jgi:hypothetical protein